jgi:hypothetical protein
VREPSGQARLAKEAPPKVLLASQILGEALQGHRPVELEVSGEVDGGHCPMSQRTDELVPAGDACRRAHPSPPWPWPWS